MSRINDRIWVLILGIPALYLFYRVFLQNKMEREWGYPSSTPFFLILGLLAIYLVWIFIRLYIISKDFAQTYLVPIFEFVKVLKPSIQPTYNAKNFTNTAATEKTWIQIRRISDQLIDRKKYEDTKAKRPRGVLLVGKKEYGRRTIAMAIAGEIKAQFFCISAHELVANTENRPTLSNLFAAAQRAEDALILIEHTEVLLNHPAVYHELGYKIQNLRDENPDQNILVMCSVECWGEFKRDYFDDGIIVDSPNQKSIEKTLWIYTRSISLNKVDIPKVAKLLNELTYAQIEWVVNRAAVIAASHAIKSITIQDFEDAIAALQPPAPCKKNGSAQ